MRHAVTRSAMIALVVVGAAFLATHMGAYPQIQTTPWYAALAVFVALNTIGFATLAAMKLGYRSGRRVQPAAR